jgi:hypothetical protein
MRAARIVSLLASASLTIWLTACGGGGSTPPPTQAISVAVSAASSSLAVGATTSITATVTNDSANAGVKWTVSCSSCGSVSPTSTLSGAATVYTAPSTVPSPATVTVTATSVTDATKTASATITITAAPPPTISVALSPTPPMSLAAGSTTSLTAVVSNDSANAGVKWTVTCSATACGSFAPTSTASGTATTYTAPSTAGFSVTVTATSVTDPTKTASATISITTTAPVITVTLNPAAPASVVAGTTASLTAVVANDSANAGVTWTVTCGSAQCGSIAPTSTASGTATTYTAPAVPPSPATVTITAKSVTDTTKTATATVAIALGVPGNGTYVYSISGENANGPYFIAGAFTVLNGAITGGEQDFSDHLNAYSNALSASGSSLSVVGSNVQIVLNTGNSAIGVGGIETLRGAPVSTSRMLISEFDTYATGTGSVDLQTSTAAPSGGYAFNLQGLDGSTNAFSLAVGGILDVTGTSISNTGSVFDYNDGGSVGQSNLFSSGSVTAPDSFGRVVFTLTPSSTTVPQFVLNGYIVGTNRIQLVEALDALDADLGGVALGQGSSTGNFTAAGIAGQTYVFTALGADSSGDLHIGGGLVFNSNATISGVLALNDLASFGSLTITAGSYTIDPTGRVTILGLTPSLVSGTPFAFQLYLDGNGNALTLGVDSTELNAGMAYLQTAPSAPFAGTYALSGQGVGVVTTTSGTSFPTWSAAGPASVNSSTSTFTGYTDYTLMGATAPTSNVTLGGTETSTSGTLALTGLNAASLSSGSAQTANTYTYFPIDTTRVIALETDGIQLGLLQLEGVTP